jgi:acyl-CoA synthetase (AMP-forming)/AMP-acid ligase II
VVRRLYGVDEQSRGVIWLPAHHDMGLFSGILQPLYAGSSILLLSPMFAMQRPLRWLQAISDFRGTVSGGPSFAFAACATALAAADLTCDELDLSTWQCAFVGAEPISAVQLQAFASAAGGFGFRPEAWTPSYGLAEASVLVTGRRGMEARMDGQGRTLVDCGSVVGGHELLIVDPRGRQVVPSGEEGEVWLSGPSVAAGYWGPSDCSAATFGARLADGRGPFLRTGDLGCLREGHLTITGRLKDVIILAGRKLHAGDIEEAARAAIGERPAIGALAAFAVEIGGLERLVLAAEAPRSVCADSSVQNQLRSALRGSIASHFGAPLHDVVFTRHKLPRTSSGKLRRFDCRRRYLSGGWSQTLEVAGC